MHTGYQSDSVLAAELGGLKEVAVDRRVCYETISTLVGYLPFHNGVSHIARLSKTSQACLSQIAAKPTQASVQLVFR